MKKEREGLVKEKNELVQKKDRLIEFYTEGSISKEQFLKKMKDYDQRESFLDEKIKGGRAEDKSKRENTFNNKSKVLLRFDEKGTQQPPPRTKTAVFKVYCGKKIIFDSNKRGVKIIGHIPLEAREETTSNVKSGALSIPSWNHGKIFQQLSQV